jgi:hypothetical protein
LGTWAADVILPAPPAIAPQVNDPAGVCRADLKLLFLL